jgi:hypothetical protein
LIRNVNFPTCNTKLALGVPRRNLRRKLATVMKTQVVQLEQPSVAPDTELFLDESLSRIASVDLKEIHSPVHFRTVRRAGHKFLAMAGLEKCLAFPIYYSFAMPNARDERFNSTSSPFISPSGKEGMIAVTSHLLGGYVVSTSRMAIPISLLAGWRKRVAFSWELT